MLQQLTDKLESTDKRHLDYYYVPVFVNEPDNLNAYRAIVYIHRHFAKFTNLFPVKCN